MDLRVQKMEAALARADPNAMADPPTTTLSSASMLGSGAAVVEAYTPRGQVPADQGAETARLEAEAMATLELWVSSSVFEPAEDAAVWPWVAYVSLERNLQTWTTP